MSEVKKSDFIFFQNEFLQEMKKLENKFNEKFSQILKSFQNEKLVTEQKFHFYDDKLSSLTIAMETNTDFQIIKKDFEKLKEQIKEERISNTNRLFYLERDLSDACFKYDSMLSSFVSIPGIIGKGCKYSEIKIFFEFIDKKLHELINQRDRSNIDLEKYKKKLETLIGQFRLQIDSSQNKYFEYCNEKIAETKNKIDERIAFFDEKVDLLRVDNGKHSFDLIQKAKELQNVLNKFDNLSNEISRILNEEMAKYQKYNKELIKVFDSQKEEFKIIKIRFTELSDFIKDVRFMRNLHNYTKSNNNQEFESTAFLKKSKNLSKKLNFDKPQKITKEEENKYMNNFTNTNNKNTINFDKNGVKENKENDNNSVTDINANKTNDNKNIRDKKNEEIETIVKSIVKENDAYINLTNNLKLNNNQKVTKNNNNITNNPYTIESSSDKNNIFSNSLQSNKSRNYKFKYNKTEKSTNKKEEKIKTQESIFNTADQSAKKKLFIKTQSQFCLNSVIIKPKIQQQLTENNFYQKNQNQKIYPFTLYEQEAHSARINSKIKEVLEKGKKFEFDEILNTLSNNNNNKNDNSINIEAYKCLKNKINKIDEKIIEYNNATKANFEKIFKKVNLYIELTNSLLKIKKEKSKIINKDSNSPVKIYTYSEFNIPLIKKSIDHNSNIDKNKIRMKSVDNNTLLNIQEKNKKVGSGIILNVIEPYLIKKFKSNK